MLKRLQNLKLKHEINLERTPRHEDTHVYASLPHSRNQKADEVSGCTHRRAVTYPTTYITSDLIATKLIYMCEAGVTAAAGTRLALQSLLFLLFQQR